MARKTTTRIQDDVREGKTVGIQKYILIVW
jgi:hypothetical protein